MKTDAPTYRAIGREAASIGHSAHNTQGRTHMDQWTLREARRGLLLKAHRHLKLLRTHTPAEPFYHLHRSLAAKLIAEAKVLTGELHRPG